MSEFNDRLCHENYLKKLKTVELLHKLTRDKRLLWVHEELKSTGRAGKQITIKKTWKVTISDKKILFIKNLLSGDSRRCLLYIGGKEYLTDYSALNISPYLIHPLEELLRELEGNCTHGGEIITISNFNSKLENLSGNDTGKSNV